MAKTKKRDSGKLSTHALQATHVFEVYSRTRGLGINWYWRLRAGGRTVADGSEPYDSKGNVKREITAIVKAIQEDKWRVVEVE